MGAALRCDRGTHLLDIVELARVHDDGRAAQARLVELGLCLGRRGLGAGGERDDSDNDHHEHENEDDDHPGLHRLSLPEDALRVC